MVRMSTLRNCPVICGNRQIGLLQSVTLDAAQKRVYALIVSCGIRGKRVVLPQDVLSIADGFILASAVQKYHRSQENAPCAFLRDTTGLLAGYVTDHAIDESTLQVQAIEMAPGYLPSERKLRIWVYTYVRPDDADNELTIPAFLCSEPTFSREGNEICAHPP